MTIKKQVSVTTVSAVLRDIDLGKPIQEITSIGIGKDVIQSDDAAHVALPYHAESHSIVSRIVSVLELPGIRLAAMSICAAIFLTAAPSDALAWGDEDWGGSGETVVMIDSSPDYLQRRIEARQQRLSAERAERARTLSVIRENDRRIERANTVKALGQAGVAITEYLDGVEYTGSNNETQVEW